MIFRATRNRFKANFNICFNDEGVLYDNKNNIKIHQYSQNTRAYDICQYLFNNNKKEKDWIFWDEIATFIVGKEVSEGMIIPEKNKIRDAIRKINEYSTNEIGSKIIMNDKKERYKIK